MRRLSSGGASIGGKWTTWQAGDCTRECRPRVRASRLRWIDATGGPLAEALDSTNRSAAAAMRRCAVDERRTEPCWRAVPLCIAICEPPKSFDIVSLGGRGCSSSMRRCCHGTHCSMRSASLLRSTSIFSSSRCTTHPSRQPHSVPAAFRSDRQSYWYEIPAGDAAHPPLNARRAASVTPLLSALLSGAKERCHFA